MRDELATAFRTRDHDPLESEGLKLAWPRDERECPAIDLAAMLASTWIEET